MSQQSNFSPKRRSFLSFLNFRAAAIAAMAATGTAVAQEKAAERWEPARHPKDDWLDQLPGKHRLVFDTTTANGFGEALAFAGNFLRVNQADYGLQDKDVAIVIVARHGSTSFAYNDAMWAKYGKQIGTQIKFDDPKTKQAPAINVYNVTDYGPLLPNHATSVDALVKRGVHFAVCSMATRAYSGLIAGKGGAETDAIFAELTANLVGNSRMAPAGVVAVSRAQERGYTLVTC